MTWYNQYCKIPPLRENIQVFMDELNNKYASYNSDNINNNNINNNKDKILEDNLNKLEINYKNKLNELEINSTDIEYINTIKHHNSLKLLQFEVNIIQLLTKYVLQNKQFNYIFLSNSLQLLLKISEILRIRLRQPEINHNNIFPNGNLIRCSYKFCNFKDTCIYNYSNNNNNNYNNNKLYKKNKCYQNHYVHHMVSADIKIVLSYINNGIQDKNFIIYNKEIFKTINTLSYVIIHMENELKSKCMYFQESEWENYHISNNGYI